MLIIYLNGKIQRREYFMFALIKVRALRASHPNSTKRLTLELLYAVKELHYNQTQI
jgi:hypothetical protein